MAAWSEWWFSLDDPAFLPRQRLSRGVLPQDVLVSREGFRDRVRQLIGHDPRHPVTDSWPHLVAELTERLERYPEPVLGVGHSLGGYLTAFAALRRPALFRAIVLSILPILGRRQGTVFSMIKRFGLADRVTPAGATRDRRAEWASADEAYAHFRNKRAFQHFDPDCLRDYVTLGMVETPHGVRLAFDPAIESRIYRTFPHGLASELQDLRVRAGMIFGRESAEARRVGLATARRHFRVVRIPGGHLFPFERPEQAALAVRDDGGTIGVPVSGWPMHRNKPGPRNS
jgi:pimeloyl-ACP methyl ester carboxylesterase